MEFKDKLKRLRKERSVSQQALADAIFVSRSAVAKWENGLGYPNDTSFRALIEYFEVDRTALETDAAEDVLIEKNRWIMGLRTAIIAAVLAFIILAVCVLPNMYMTDGVHAPDYGFTSGMVAGKFADDNCIHLPDYDIYWYTIMSEEQYATIDGFRPVKKNWYGFTVSESDYASRKIYLNGTYVGILYSIEGKGGYYNIIKKNVNLQPVSLLKFEKVTVGNAECEVLYNSFFISSEYVETFTVGENVYQVVQ